MRTFTSCICVPHARVHGVLLRLDHTGGDADRDSCTSRDVGHQPPSPTPGRDWIELSKRFAMPRSHAFSSRTPTRRGSKLARPDHVTSIQKRFPSVPPATSTNRLTSLVICSPDKPSAHSPGRADTVLIPVRVPITRCRFTSFRPRLNPPAFVEALGFPGSVRRWVPSGTCTGGGQSTISHRPGAARQRGR